MYLYLLLLCDDGKWKKSDARSNTQRLLVELTTKIHPQHRKHNEDAMKKFTKLNE